ncbi:prokaryotic cytochrome C oxidase subunit IV family protein [Mycobacterium kyorinense]|uniref:Prokaryotic cytochrome C oxidase subunit IV family protein n=1 Tax=Mycobacterium kyorinense TaxID=487514 RepID=A0A1A2YTV0_9MYCO|nr:cytochrome C oxidase subunit IV family protein [Mycobacterium kyorinense]OBI40672.1 prokaryotic cytochrome C oxidase subunit IV family protein [Mycobacterium kyorinense]
MTTTARLTGVWLILSAITVVTWWLGPAHTHGTPTASLAITIAVLALALVKAHLIIANFMEVRTAPWWLRLSTDGWLLALWGAILAIYFW